MPMEMSKRPGAQASKRATRFGVYLLAAASQIAAVEAQSFVAGTTPDRRPEGAPKIEKFEKSPQWLETATAGVTKPLPPSLKFLDVQGGWFQPFIHPGMTGPYDIRGWHAARDDGASQKTDQGH